MNMSVKTLHSWFWDDNYWLPPNVTWSDLESDSDMTFAKSSDLWYPIPAALLIMVVRYMSERLLFRPFGVMVGLRPTNAHRRAAPNAALEKKFKQLLLLQKKYPQSTNHKPSAMNTSSSLNLSRSEVQELEVSSGLTERQVERWFRKRKLQDRPTTLDKFSETCWRCFYYSFVFIYGLMILHNKPWLWDIRYCWYHYPKHALGQDVWFYYMLELSFYWSLAISQFFDVKRKDFWEMFIHHMCTISLMALSWVCNLTRVGTLVLLVHDSADIFLESAKLFKYANYQRFCDFLFVLFTITWIVTRLGVFPTWILYSTTIEAPQIVEMFPAYYIFNFLLSVLLVLHVIWTYFILKIVYSALMSGETGKDSRSESSNTTISESEDDDKENNSNYMKDSKKSK